MVNQQFPYSFLLKIPERRIQITEDHGDYTISFILIKIADFQIFVVVMAAIARTQP